MLFDKRTLTKDKILTGLEVTSSGELKLVDKKMIAILKEVFSSLIKKIIS